MSVGADLQQFFVLGAGAVLFLTPMLLAAKTSKRANENSAIRGIMDINVAEARYETTYPENGYACSLAALGGDPRSGPGTPSSAHILSPDLASGIKAGYRFRIFHCMEHKVRGIDRVTGYNVIAQPIKLGETGNRTFCSDETGQIRFDPTGGTTCTEILQ